ncbi:hypothetical protein [Nocardioides ferulae]|uniref:hypothetical protein n=1 Tax=Nocardioides ferulae TaxID=2340821 RepID=UPI001F0C81AC|nr:hypothetical protein [Nocardioides ferulae]
MALGAAVLPGLGEEPREGSQVAGEGPSSDPAPSAPAQQRRPDRPLAVAASDMPAEVAGLVPDGEPGPVVRGPLHPLVDDEQNRIVHFRWDGTLTTLVIEPAFLRAGCAQQAAPESDWPGGKAPTVATATCEIVAGLEMLTWPASDPDARAHGVSVWNHGYIVSAVSYDAVDGKNPDGSEDVEPLLDEPALSLEELAEIVRSEVWFGEPAR